MNPLTVEWIAKAEEVLDTALQAYRTYRLLWIGSGEINDE
jgi:hypothetical protein